MIFSLSAVWAISSPAKRCIRSPLRSLICRTHHSLSKFDPVLGSLLSQLQAKELFCLCTTCRWSVSESQIDIISTQVVRKWAFLELECDPGAVDINQPRPQDCGSITQLGHVSQSGMAPEEHLSRKWYLHLLDVCASNRRSSCPSKRLARAYIELARRIVPVLLVFIFTVRILKSASMRDIIA